MRFHSRYPLLQCWLPRERELMRADSLSVARCEPTVSEGVHGGAVLDLVFSGAGHTAVLPFVMVQAPFLVQRERTPLIWPDAARVLGADVLLALERLLIPWLQSRTLARQENEEIVRNFRPSDEGSFEAARAAGLLGAARYGDLMPAFSPYVYAARFCAQRTVGIQDACGANGAAMLAARAKDVRADLCTPERNALAGAWFGIDIFGEIAADYDVAVAPAGSTLRAGVARIALDSNEEEARIVHVASAVPTDVLVSFDPEDAPVARTFSVRALVQPEIRARESAAPRAAAGGSSGVILMLLREGFDNEPDADADEARELASRLRAEGFAVELRSPSALESDLRVDLVHAFGLADPGVPPVLQAMRGKGVPVVANTALATVPQEAAWGPNLLSAVYGRAADDAMLAEYLELIGLRKLSTETPVQPVPLGRALEYVDVAIAGAATEEAQLRDDYAFRGEVVRYAPSFEGATNPAAEIASLAGTAPFALAHAPVDWRTNSPLLARIAASHGVPLVLAGPAVSLSALRAALQVAPELITHVPRPSQAHLEALYRSARVYIDLSWAPLGLGRIARAAASGCRLLLSRASHAAQVWPSAAQADPGSVDSMSSAFGQAWNAPQPPLPPNGPDLFSAAIFAYSRAVQARQPT